MWMRPSTPPTRAQGGREPEHLDVVIVGAGPVRHRHRLPPRARAARAGYALLEARDDLGGTWSLFRYPGHPLGLRHAHPRLRASARGRTTVALADGSSILRVRARHRARSTASTATSATARASPTPPGRARTQRWTLTVDRPPTGESTLTCSFLLWCSGYYRYDQGYTPELPGHRELRRHGRPPAALGPGGLDYAGKRVVVIGSGATAVTLVPAMTQGERRAAHVTQLQRTPSYVLSIGRTDPVAEFLSRWVPAPDRRPDRPREEHRAADRALPGLAAVPGAS